MSQYEHIKQQLESIRDELLDTDPLEASPEQLEAVLGMHAGVVDSLEALKALESPLDTCNYGSEFVIETAQEGVWSPLFTYDHRTGYIPSVNACNDMAANGAACRVVQTGRVVYAP